MPLTLPLAHRTTRTQTRVPGTPVFGHWTLFIQAKLNTCHCCPETLGGRKGRTLRPTSSRSSPSQVNAKRGPWTEREYVAARGGSVGDTGLHPGFERWIESGHGHTRKSTLYEKGALGKNCREVGSLTASPQKIRWKLHRGYCCLCCTPQNERKQYISSFPRFFHYLYKFLGLQILFIRSDIVLISLKSILSPPAYNSETI